MRLPGITAATFLSIVCSTPRSQAFTPPSTKYHFKKTSSALILSTLLAHHQYRREYRFNIILAAVKGTEGTDNSTCNTMYDLEYPGTAVERLRAVHERVAVIANDETLNGPWEEVRRRILWAGGLKDLPNSIPGQGYTGHCFNDYNHVDLTTMNDEQSDNLNDGSVKGIATGNRLGPGIRIASIPEPGPGGSWSTCANGCNQDPPSDVAHVQFRSRIAFKLVWVPNDNYDTFVLVDDEGKLLAKGKPTGVLPNRRQREMNYMIMKGSKYATVVDSLAASN